MALGSATKALSTSAVALDNHPCRWANVHNNDGSINILIGGTSTAQSFTLGPGENTGPIPINNTNRLFVKSASGTPTCSYMWE